MAQRKWARVATHVVDSDPHFLQLPHTLTTIMRATSLASGRGRASLAPLPSAAARCRRSSVMAALAPSYLSARQTFLAGATLTAAQQPPLETVFLRRTGHGIPRISRSATATPLHASCSSMPHFRYSSRAETHATARAAHCSWPSPHFTGQCVSVQVADFMGDAHTIASEALAVGRACFAAGVDASDALVDAVRGLPPHLLRAVMGALLRARELPQLLDSLHAALHRALVGTAVMQTSNQGLNEHETTTQAVQEQVSAQANDASALDATTARLQLCPGAYSSGACSSIVGLIPLLPPLSAAICGAALPATNLVDALSVHASLTRLDLSGTGVTGACVSARALADALPSWPGMRALCLGKRDRTQFSPIQAASDILAPALSDMTALTSLDLSRMPITAALARAVGALTELAALQLDCCTGVHLVGVHLPALSRLSTLRARGVALTQRSSVDDRLDLRLLDGLAASTALVHLDLRDSMHDLAGLELAVLLRLESLHVGDLSDSSVPAIFGAVPPFAAEEHACRFGLRALPHLQLLAHLSMDDVHQDTEIIILTMALPLMPRLASFEIGRTCEESDERALAAGWVGRRVAAQTHLLPVIRLASAA